MNGAEPFVFWRLNSFIEVELGDGFVRHLPDGFFLMLDVDPGCARP